MIHSPAMKNGSRRAPKATVASVARVARVGVAWVAFLWGAAGLANGPVSPPPGQGAVASPPLPAPSRESLTAAKKRASDAKQILIVEFSAEWCSPCKQFERDGFVVLPDFVDPSACDALKARANELVAGFEPDATVRSIFSTNEQTRTTDDYFLGSGDDIRFFFEEEAFGPDGELNQPLELSINKFGHAQHDLDPVFDSFSRSPELADVADRLGFGGHVLVQSMYIFKQPHIGGEVTCHQDATFLYTEPMTVMGLWFALEDATQKNGCLWARPGGHQENLRRRFVRTAQGEGGGTRFVTLDARPLDESGLLPLEVPAGTLIVLHGLLPHRSDANRSARSRHAYSVHLVEKDAHYPQDNWLQRPTLPARGFAE